MTLVFVQIFFSKKLFLISGVLFLLSQVTMLVILSGVATGGEILSHQTTFSPEEFQAILNSWGPENVQRFLSHYYLDFIHPVLYFVFLACCLSWAWSKNIKAWMLALPLIAAIGDEFENLFQISITLDWVPHNSVWFYIGAASSRMKWFFVVLTLMAIFIGFFRNQKSNSSSPQIKP